MEEYVSVESCYFTLILSKFSSQIFIVFGNCTSNHNTREKKKRGVPWTQT